MERNIMKLLICTQAVDKNHSNLALFHSWIEEFAKQCEKVHVICLYEGTHALPENVRVYSLGKPSSAEATKGAGARLMYTYRFFRYILRLRNEHDAVFVHMNPEYVVLGGIFWRAWRKKIALWYTHKNVDLKLRLAAHGTDIIFTASRESFRLKSNKVRVVGHGIDTELFRWSGVKKIGLNIATAGRISKTKQLIEMLGGLDMLQVRGVPFTLAMAGEPITAQDKTYEEQVYGEVRRRPYAEAVHFAGTVAYRTMPAWLADKSVFLNLSLTGSLDRAVLEAAAAGVVPVSSNEAFKEWLEPYGLYVKPEPQAIADGIIKASQTDPAPLAGYVRREHSLAALIPRILQKIYG